MATSTKSTRSSSTRRSPKATSRSGRTTTSSRAKKATDGAKPSKQSTSRQRATATTPPAASVAAAQKVLRTVERRENALRAALKRHKKALKKLKKTAAAHGDTVKQLKGDLKEVAKARKTVSADL